MLTRCQLIRRDSTSTAEPDGGGDFQGRTPPALDGAVHVALPALAGVLAREEETSGRTRQPLTQRRIERRVEERVPASRKRIRLPDDLPRCRQLRAVDAEPSEPRD